MPITLKDAIYSASLLGGRYLPPLQLKSKQTAASVVGGYMDETQAQLYLA
jgi:hypothetical protein